MKCIYPVRPVITTWPIAQNIVFIVIMFFCTSHTRSQSLLESNRRGIELLRYSMAAHGGEQTVESIKLSFKVSNHRFVNEAQSFLPEPPFDHARIEREYKIDYSGESKLFVSRTVNYAPGDFIFGGSAILKDNEGFVYDPLTREYDEIKSNPMQVIIFLPQVYIYEALKNLYAVRLLDSGTVDGREYYRLSVTGANQVRQEFTIDKQSGLVAEVQFLRPAGVYGDAVFQIQFSNYRAIGEDGFVMPEQTTTLLSNSVFANVKNMYTLHDFSTSFTIAESAMTLPEGYRKGDYTYRKSFELHKLAGNIYMIENVTGTTGRWSYNILFAVFEDFVLVSEAVSNDDTTQKIIAKIKAVAPGKPVKYLVQTHHHGDHLGGIRGYIAEGTTIISTPGNTELIQRIARAPYTVTPDRLARNPKDAIIEVVKDKRRVIKDKTLEAVIYDIGSPHAKEMLVVYFPKEKILYQSDLINEGEYPDNESTRDFLRKLKLLKWDVHVIVGSHGKVLWNKQALEAKYKNL